MLSKRLLTISEMILKDEVVFDCGSDHALLPCFLILNNMAKKVYAGDLRPGPLKQAQNNIDYYKLNDRVILVLSDGLERMNDDVTVVTISGMGFNTVEHILNEAKLDNLKLVVVQVNKGANKLRAYLSQRHFEIVDERVVHDDFFYEIVAFKPSKTSVQYSLKEIEYGPILLKLHSPTFIDYLNDRIDKLTKVYHESQDDKFLNQIQELQSIIKAAE